MKEFYQEWRLYKKKFRYYKFMGGTAQAYYEKLFRIFKSSYNSTTTKKEITSKSPDLAERRALAKAKRKVLFEKYNK